MAIVRRRRSSSEAELVEQRRSSLGAGEAIGGLGGVDGEEDERAPSPAR